PRDSESRMIRMPLRVPAAERAGSIRHAPRVVLPLAQGNVTRTTWVRGVAEVRGAGIRVYAPQPGAPRLSPAHRHVIHRGPVVPITASALSLARAKHSPPHRATKRGT